MDPEHEQRLGRAELNRLIRRSHTSEQYVRGFANYGGGRKDLADGTLACREKPPGKGVGDAPMPFLGLAMFLFAAPGNVAADEKHDAAYQACAKACNDCQRACDHCTTHCATLVAEGKKEHLTTLKECQDCATCCTACAQVCARGGPQTALMTDCCAKCCDQCAKACEKFPDDKHMKACAEECRKCQKACEAMAKHVSK